MMSVTKDLKIRRSDPSVLSEIPMLSIRAGSLSWLTRLLGTSAQAQGDDQTRTLKASKSRVCSVTTTDARKTTLGSKNHQLEGP